MPTTAITIATTATIATVVTTIATVVTTMTVVLGYDGGLMGLRWWWWICGKDCCWHKGQRKQSQNE